MTDTLTKVQWKPDEVDALFDLLGDFDGNGLAEGPDYGSVNGRDNLLWQQQNGNGVGSPSLNTYSADGDDDGDVDGDDLNIWSGNHGNWLVLEELTAVLA